MLKSKIERAKIDESSLEAEEYLMIDRELMRRADIWPFERVEVSNLDNGARFTLVVREAPAGTGKITIGGPASYLARPGHRIIICSYVQLSEADLPGYRPRLVTL